MAFIFVDATHSPEVQAFGFRVLLDKFKSYRHVASWSVRGEAKAWFTRLMASERWASAAAFVRSKCAEAVVELARSDWPQAWPELQEALLSCSQLGPGPACLALGVWCQLADLVAEDAKDLPLNRKRELSAALLAAVEREEMGSQGPGELTFALDRALQLHGAFSITIAVCC
jgi:hypothetical protein